MAVPNLKTCEFSLPMTSQHPVGDVTTAIGRGYLSSTAKFNDINVPWGHCFEVLLLRATNEHESNTFDIDVILGTGQYKLSPNYYHNSDNGDYDTSNAINTATPYVNSTEPGISDYKFYLAHEKEVTADNYVDIITRDTPLFLNEGNSLRFETTSDYTQDHDKTLVMTISYIDHYG